MGKSCKKCNAKVGLLANYGDDNYPLCYDCSKTDEKCDKCKIRLIDDDRSESRTINDTPFCKRCFDILMEKTDKEEKKHDLSGNQSSFDSLDLQLDELERASNYRILQKNLRPAAIGSMIFGIIAITTGFAAMDENPVNAILGMIGIILLAEGIWLMVTIKPSGLLLDGIALLLIGFWNIIISMAKLISEGGGTSVFLGLGAMQLYLGGNSFGRYARFSKMTGTKPTEKTIAVIDDLIVELSQTGGSGLNDVIEFRVKNSLWKGRLKEDVCIFIDMSQEEVIFPKKSQVNIKPQGEGHPEKEVQATFNIKGRNLVGTISSESYRKYETWKRKEAVTEQC